MQTVQHDAHIFLARIQKQLFGLLKGCHVGPGHKFYADGLLILRGQLTQTAKLIGVKAAVRGPNVGQDIANTKLSGGGQRGFILGYIHSLSNTGIFRVVELDAGLLGGPAGFKEQLAVF